MKWRKDTSIARIALIGVRDEPGVAFKAFRILASAKINVDIILQSIGHKGLKDISFTVDKKDTQQAMKVLEDGKDIVGFSDITMNDKIAKISIVGAGMMAAPGVAAQMFEALFDAKINIGMISTSEIKISVLVDEHEADRAVSAIHAMFFGR